MDIPLDDERLAFAEELEEVALQLSLLDPALELATQLAQVDAEYERLAMTADMYGWQDMAAVVAWCRSALVSPVAPDLLVQGKFFGWLEMAALVLREPDELGHLPMLTGELMDMDWPEPLPPDLLQRFLVGLRSAQQDESAAGLDDGSDKANAPDSNRLAFAADVHPELLAAYLEETPGHVTEAARLIRLMAIGAGNRDQRRQASRLVHTIKGSSGVVGVDAVAGFAHQLEDLLDLPFKVLPDGLGSTLEASADCLEALFDNLRAGRGLPDEYAGLQVQLEAWKAKLGTDDAGEDDLPDTLSALGKLPDFINETAPTADDAELGLLAGGDRAAGGYPALSEERIRRLLGLTGELITSTSQTAELLQQANRMGKQLYQQDEQIRQRLDELEGVIDQQAQRQGSASKAMPKDGRGLDELEMESYSDLYSASNLLIESAADSREMVQNMQQLIRRLTDELYQQQRVQRQLSEAVLATRLTPVSTLVPRLERIVRETCRKTGKQADIQIQGQHLQVDADILKGMADPLLHLLRNAVDHGIELPTERRAAGKPETGQINLAFAQRGSHITLTLEDDGAGMDAARIRARALERGLLREGDELGDDALLRLILQPGFSTCDEVNEVSGRGVGMDVVQSAVEQLRGTLHLQTILGAGSKILVDLPQTLIATHALVVRTGGNLVAVPADSIEQLLYVSPEESTLDESGWHIRTNRYQLPVTHLAHVLHWPSAEISIKQAHTLLVVRSETQVHAFYAEEILPSRDIVIKSLAPWLNYLSGVQGACILANGTVAPVLDMIRLLNDMESGALQPKASGVEVMVAPVRRGLSVLVVDDSLSNRKSLRLMLEAMGHTVQTAVDGLDALQLLNNSKVDMVLTDLEMPRMNGLEMTQAIRIWPEMKHLPVIMITSRSTRKHRELAEQAGVDSYLTKPVQPALLQEHMQKWLDTQLAIA